MIPQHGHCQMCGKAVKYGEPFCSEKCKEEYENFIKKRKRMMYILYFLIAIIVAMYILTALHGG